MNANFKVRYRNLREQYGDQVLTALTILILLMMFVAAPLSAVGIAAFQEFGFVVGLAMIVGALFMSGNIIAFIAMSAAFGMNLTAALHRLRNPSAFDLYLVAAAWLILAIALGEVVARQVFAAGRVTYHRIIGNPSVFFDLADVCGFVCNCWPNDPEGIFRHRNRRQYGSCQQSDLFQFHDADLDRLRRYRASAPNSAQPLQS